MSHQSFFTVFWVSSKHMTVHVSVETQKSFNTNHILELFTPQPLTTYHFLAAWRVSISYFLCFQGEETLVLRKCFEGVRRDGDLIRVRDTVLLKSGPRKKSLPYVAKISALWEDPESGSKHAVRSVYFQYKRTWINVVITVFKKIFFFFRRADDEFVLVLPSRTHTGGPQPQYTLWGEEQILLYSSLSGRQMFVIIVYKDTWT